MLTFDDIFDAACTGNTSILQQHTPDDVAHIDINQYSPKSKPKMVTIRLLQRYIVYLVIQLIQI